MIEAEEPLQRVRARKPGSAPPRRKICRGAEVETMLSVEGRVWYAFTVAPGKEFLVETILRGIGLPAFVPVQYRLRRACSRIKRKIQVPYVLASRYVFVGFDGPVPWGRMFGSGVVQRVVGYHESPVGLRPALMRHLFSVGTESKASTHNALLNKSIQVGELVRVTDGPFHSFAGKLEEITASHGRLTLEIFGRPTPVELPLEILDSAA